MATDRGGIPQPYQEDPNRAGNATPEIAQTLRDLTALLRAHGAVLNGDPSRVELKLSNSGRIFDGVKKVALVAGLLFAAGGAYQVFVERNTTDDELQTVLKIHSKTPHPATEQRLVGIEVKVGQIDTTLKSIGEHQLKAAARGEYQFHFSRWQSDILECQRRHCRRPLRKPPKLKELEASLITGR